MKAIWGWKYLAGLPGLVIGVAGIAISMYWPLADLKAHSLSMNLMSSAALQPATGARIQDLQVTLNGNKIENPYLSTFTITNTGSKPIASSDFESPISISVKGGARLVTAQVTETKPNDIPVSVGFDNNKIKVLPFLSNSNDEISIAVITSGLPEFFPTARIAGVPEVTYQDLRQVQIKPAAAAFACFVTALAGFLYIFLLYRGALSSQILIGPWIRLSIIFCLAVCGNQALQRLADEFSGMPKIGAAIIVIAGLIGLGGGLAASMAMRRSDRAQGRNRFP